MKRRPPILIWRFITADVWRLLLLTAAVLVTVLSFAGAVRLLAEGRLGPLETLRLMLLFMPPMLQYALPFAAGFGATLAYHRWCSDNEVTACFAAGVGHRSLLMPVAISGVVLGAVIFGLQNEIIPRFLRSIEQLITRDAARYIIGSIERKDAVKLGNTHIYADLVRRVPRTGTAGKDESAYEQLYMKRLMVVTLDKAGQIEMEISAEEADVWLVRETVVPSVGTDGSIGGDTITRVIIKPRGVRARTIGKQGSDVEYTLMSYVIPNAFNDDPKFLTWNELEELKVSPDRINFIESRRRVLAANLIERRTTSAIDAALRSTGEVNLLDRDGQPMTLRGGSIAWDLNGKHWAISPSAGPASTVELVRTLESGRMVVQSAESAWLRTAVTPTSPDEPVSLVIQLTGVRTGAGERSPSASLGTGGSLRSFTLDGVSLAQSQAPALRDQPSAELLALASEHLAPLKDGDDFVEKPAKDLRRRLLDLRREIQSKQHERLASSAACCVMIITGAVMALRLRSRLPLTVYLWAFFPALFAVITISAGQQTTHHNGPWGLLVLWGGVASLVVYTVMQYRKVAVH